MSETEYLRDSTKTDWLKVARGFKVSPQSPACTRVLMVEPKNAATATQDLPRHRGCDADRL